jgi:hypothetical protein
MEVQDMHHLNYISQRGPSPTTLLKAKLNSRIEEDKILQWKNLSLNQGKT